MLVLLVAIANNIAYSYVVGINLIIVSCSVKRERIQRSCFMKLYHFYNFLYIK